MIFNYPTSKHERKHGPVGYEDYTSYKPWLRDEFTFRCIYCLYRERWLPARFDVASFSVEHLVPKSVDPTLINAYDNLFYSCTQCNSWRGVKSILDLKEEPLGLHVEVDQADGSIRGLTPEGRRLIEELALDDPDLAKDRKHFMDLLALIQSALPQANGLLTRYFGFPDDLPDLSGRKPKKNTRPSGIVSSYLALRKLGRLPATY